MNEWRHFYAVRRAIRFPVLFRGFWCKAIGPYNPPYLQADNDNTPW